MLDRVRSWLRIKRSIRLSILPATAEPGVWGVFRPIVFLPERLAEELSDAELEAVMMHEVIHVARWDNLIANLHRLLCCLFWFHPIIWLLDRLLLAERERACDEEVIRLGGAPEVYASSLIKVLRFCLGWSVVGASNATGSNLGRRVERIMSRNSRVTLSVWHRVAVGSIVIVVVVVSITAGLLTRAGAAQTDVPGELVIAAVPGGVTEHTTRGKTSAEVRMPQTADSMVQGTVVRWLKQVGDLVARGEPLFEMSANQLDTQVLAASSGVLAEIRVQEGQTVPINTIVAVIQHIDDEIPGVSGGATSFAFPAGQEQLIQRLDQAPETMVEYRNSSKSPVLITAARARSVPRETNGSGDEFAVAPVVTLTNNTDRRVKGITLEFRNDLERRAYYERTEPLVEPHGLYTTGGQNRFLILVGGPAGWSVRVGGVVFEDGEVWGVVPPAPPPPPPLPPPADSLRELDQAPDTAIRFKNPEGAPVSITAASAKAVRLEGSAREGLPPGARFGYLIRLTTQFVNNTDRRVTGMAIGCGTPDSTSITYASTRIEPGGSGRFELPAVDGGFIVVHGDPERLEARVVEVRFEDGGVWPAQAPISPIPEVPTQSDSTLIRKSGGVLAESATHRVLPESPPLARAARITGSVVVEVTVDEAGDVISARAISGHPLLKDAAVNAAGQWHFTPTILSGVAVRVIGTLTFYFEP